MAGSIRLDQALQSAAASLRDVSENPHLDVQILLAHVLERERSWLLAHPEFRLDESTAQAFELLVKRVQQGEALPYVTGERWFFGRKFFIEPSVLIPRPETELLVEAALKFLELHPDRRRAADVGTGSGCIAVTLCAEVPDLELYATDTSLRAIDTARRNALQHNVEQNIHFFVGDLLRGIETDFDLICANLPYIPRGRLLTLSVAKREPLSALDGGEEGLDLIVSLIQQAGLHLGIGGRMILEIDESHGQRVLELVESLYSDWSVGVTKDYGGRDRILIVDRKS